PRALEPQAGHTDGNVQLTAAHLDVEGGGLLEALKIGRRQPNHGLAKSHHIEHSMPPSSSAGRAKPVILSEDVMGLWPATLHENGLGFCNSLVFNRDIGYFHGSEESLHLRTQADTAILRRLRLLRMTVSGVFSSRLSRHRGAEDLLHAKVRLAARARVKLMAAVCPDG